jgi:hypothetical protein
VINNIKLKFGKAPAAPSEIIKTTPVTVFVGPNNSGKSLVLTEIHGFCCRGTKSLTDHIIDELDFASFDPSVAEQKISKVTLKPRLGEALQPGHILVGKRGSRLQLNASQLSQAFQNPNAMPSHFCQWYLQYNTLKLDGQSRISLINQQGAGDLLQPPQTSFQVLFKDDRRREEVRRIVYEAFGTYFAIDPTNLGQLRLRLANRPPKDAREERRIHEEAVTYHGDALPIEQASDGVKAFTGIITEILAGDPAVLLIDEPEAFLHPSLSFKLGHEISRASSGSEKRLFVSTHSPNFVMGCIQSGAPVNIIRLTYRNGVATARILPNEDILKLMRNPLLRSTGVLNGLFYEFVVVTESDADRAFYQEINERLLRFAAGAGIPNCLFLNAQNKQTLRILIRPLRALGIPAAGIVDIDIVKEGGTVWSSFLEGGFVPEIDRHSFSTTRTEIKQRFDKTGKNIKREGGIELLTGEDKVTVNNLFDRLSDYGLFVVRRGELEKWLPDLNAAGHGPSWLMNVFERMGEDPEAESYMKPSEGDVWDFIYKVKQWLTNPNRKGIPT